MPFGQPPGAAPAAQFAARPAGFGGPHAAAPAAAPAAIGGFQRGAPARPAAPPPRAASRWAGVQSAQDREPFMRVGYYRVRVMSNEIGQNPNTREESFKGHVQIIAAQAGSESQPGDACATVQKLSGKSAERGHERAKAYVVAAAGYLGDHEYDAFDPEGKFMDAVTGAANEYSAAGLTIVGRLVDVRVSRGNDVLDKTTKQPTGDYYREYSWTVVPEDEQDATPMPVVPV